MAYIPRRPSYLHDTVVTVQSPPCIVSGYVFANSTFYLSGAINVLLFLIIRPGLLLFPRPKELDREEIQLTPTPQGTGPAIVPDTAQFHHSPEPISAAVEDGGFRDMIAAPSHISSRQILDDI